MYYVPIPINGFEVQDPNRGDIVAGRAEFTDLVRSLFVDKRFIDMLDLFSANDLRQKLIDGVPGSYAEITDTEFAVLKHVVTKPTTINSALLTSKAIVDWCRSVVSAPTTKPAPVAAPALPQASAA